MTIHVLTTGRPMSFVRDRLAAAYTVHDLVDADDRDALIAAVAPDVRALVTTGSSGADADLISRLPAVEIIAHFGVGYDPVDVQAAAARGIVVTNTPDVLTDEVADTALGLLLMTVRELSAAERWLRAGRWETEGPYRLSPSSLKGRSLGIFGFGRIGRAIARRAEAFGMPIAYHNRRPVPDVAYPYFETLEALAGAVDTLMVVAPGGASTFHRVNAAVLDALGPEGILINVGRGSVVDEAALAAALRERRILAAGLDVFEDEPRVHPDLLAVENAVLLPHVASGSLPTRRAMGQLQLDNLASWFRTGAPVTPVPETTVVPRR